MKTKTFLARCLLGAMLFSIATPVSAGAACYSPAQMHAEQLLRLHSELMVITTLCRQGSSGQPLPSFYGSFTKQNIGMLHDAEQTMIGYYGATAKGNPVAKLDRLRTLLANEYGQKAATMTSPRFCAAYRDKVIHFTSAPPQEIETEVASLQTYSRAYAPRCNASAAIAPQRGR